jgi:hypothetical protein
MTIPREVYLSQRANQPYLYYGCINNDFRLNSPSLDGRGFGEGGERLEMHRKMPLPNPGDVLHFD